jgi:hypothetical protein
MGFLGPRGQRCTEIRACLSVGGAVFFQEEEGVQVFYTPRCSLRNFSEVFPRGRSPRVNPGKDVGILGRPITIAMGVNKGKEEGGRKRA